MTTNDPPKSKNGLEWAVFAVSCVVVAATAALLVIAALGIKDRPAELHAETGRAEWKNGWLTVPVSVANTGGKVATEVEVRVETTSGGETLEAGFTLDFVPRDAKRHGSVSFRTESPDTEPRCRILGYEEP